MQMKIIFEKQVGVTAKVGRSEDEYNTYIPT